MEEINEILESWKNLNTTNDIFTKDYIFEKGKVHLVIAVSVEGVSLFKTFTAVCNVNKQEIENAIEKLDEKKDELI